MPANDVTVKALFEPVLTEPTTFTVAYSVTGGNGSIAATVDGVAITSGVAVEEGKDVVFTAAPNSGYRVAAWTHNGATVSGNRTNAFTLVNLTANATVTVTFGKVTGIGEIPPANPLRAWIRNGLLHVEGLTEDTAWSVYSVSGILLYRSIATSAEADVALPAEGVYIIQSEERTVKVVFN
jgi:hypothetical protein